MSFELPATDFPESTSARDECDRRERASGSVFAHQEPAGLSEVFTELAESGYALSAPTS